MPAGRRMALAPTAAVATTPKVRPNMMAAMMVKVKVKVKNRMNKWKTVSRCGDVAVFEVVMLEMRRKERSVVGGWMSE
jgi:hypothetical protein